MKSPQNTVSKSAACLIAVVAFLIGVEAGHMNQNTLNATASNAPTEWSAPSESGAAPQKKSNIPQEKEKEYTRQPAQRHTTAKSIW